MHIQRNKDAPPTLTIELSRTQARLIEALGARGVYGHSDEEIVLRIVDEALREFLSPTELELIDVSTGEGPSFK